MEQTVKCEGAWGVEQRKRVQIIEQIGCYGVKTCSTTSRRCREDKNCSNSEGHIVRRGFVVEMYTSGWEILAD